MRSNNSYQKGFTLIEMVVYVTLLGMVSVFIIQSYIQITGAYSRARSERAALSNARTVLEAIANAASEARAVYGPTSRFNTDSGQLSLLTSATSTPGHTSSYMDFWSDNGRVFTRAEGESAFALSDTTVRFSVFRFERIAQSLGRDAVKITIRADSASQKYPASVTLTTTAALRGNY